MESSYSDADSSTLQVEPTPYTDVNAVLTHFFKNIQEILGKQFFGMYLCGSIALRDFKPQSSDIDLIVVTNTDINDDLFAALQFLHSQFNTSGSPWAGKVEVVYISRNGLRGSAPVSTQYPQVERDTTLFKGPLEDGWACQRYILREHGIALAGPNPQTLLDAVDPEDMRRTKVIAEKWLEQAEHDPGWLHWLQYAGGQPFVVLTLCRLLYTLDKGTVASKPMAARWGQQTLDRRWHDLIEHALAEQGSSKAASDSEIENTLALLRYTVEQSQR